jgi:adenosylcobinamide-GDP ribazoletransferase
MFKNKIVGFFMRHFGIILQFMTRLYLPIDFKSTAEDITKGLRYFTLVGGVIGLILLGVANLLRYSNSSYVFQAMVLVAIWVIVTGGLHLDGVADSADGLLSGRSRERMLEIMKDSHIGSFGVIALIGLLGFKYAVVLELINRWEFMPLLMAPIIGRGYVVLVAAAFPYAREEGMGNFFIGKVTQSDLWVNGLSLLAVLSLGGVKGIIIALLTASVIWFMTRSIQKTLNGITGDNLGLVIETAELIFMILWIL